jgi:hypothetical protein
VALTLSLWPALMSGVEGGVHVGMAPARLALEPAAAARRRAAPVEPTARALPRPLRVVPLTRPIVLTHPGAPARAVDARRAGRAGAPARGARDPALGWLAVAALRHGLLDAAALIASATRAPSRGAR